MKYNIFFFVLLLLFFIVHFPFLHADADYTLLSGSRGAWTDEGLVTIQLRNYINFGVFSFIESDQFLKTPFFTFILFLPFKLFGAKLLVARLVVLVLFIATAIRIYYYQNIIGVIFVIVSMFFAPIFHYAHICNPEILCISCILISSVLFAHFITKSKTKYLVYSNIFILTCIFIKIQFAYVILLPLFAILIEKFLFKEKKIKNKILGIQILTLVITTFVFLLYIIVFKTEFEFIAKMQSAEIAIDKYTIQNIKLNIQKYFLAKRYILFIFTFCISILLLVVFYSKSKNLKGHLHLLLFLLLWIGIEMHKLTMSYLPVRYMISFYVALGMFSSVIYASLLTENVNKYSKYIAYFILVPLSAINLFFYVKAYSLREFQTVKINSIIKKLNTKEVILGVWAPTITWDSRNYAVPLWSEYYSLKELDLQKAGVFVSEPDQAESENAFLNNGINLSNDLQYVINNRIEIWTINIYVSKK
jgi:hypothetical protein